jgi:hypothetical protein
VGGRRGGDACACPRALCVWHGCSERGMNHGDHAFPPAQLVSRPPLHYCAGLPARSFPAMRRGLRSCSSGGRC